ncbi:MAG: 16S rRNA (adenine(1518)-N(6)/adenine(1519)-N(6))-dimethyltransferase RsmA [Pseudomonadota bacterium]
MTDGTLAIDGLPPLRQVIEAHDLATKKALGQNFLLDLNLTGRIARTAGNLQETTVIEVGPGPGGLTRALLMHEAKHVIAIERDPRCLPILAGIQAHYPGRLTVVEGDALDVDLAELSNGPTAVIANLPYNVGTQLLVNWLSVKEWPPFYHSMTLMFQREVAERIVATASDKHFGRLGVLAGWRSVANIAFDVPPQAFWPPPKVTSSIVQIYPREKPIECDAAALELVAKHAFGQRRKMLRQSLKSIGGAELLANVGIDETRRAETLSVEEFCALANAFKEAR